MADIIIDGTVRVAYVPAIASIASPTTTELNAGILLQSILTMDGLMGYEADTAEVSTTALNSTYDSKMPGRASFSNTALQLKRQTGTDTAYTTLTRGTLGYIVVRRNGTAETTAWASTNPVEVYPIACGEIKHQTPAENTVQLYQVPTMVYSAPNLRATVA